MRLLTARLVFLGFIGLIGGITYNALYLQDPRSATGPTAIVLPEAANPPGSDELGSEPAASEPPRLPAVRADLPPLQEQEAPGQLVKAVQRELAVRGYNSGTPDGTLHDQTRSAISSFQKDHGLIVTGAPSDELLRQILLGDTVKPAAATGAVTPQNPGAAPGTDDATVKAVQQILSDLGYAPGPIDGAMGSATESAISAFQRDRKIAATGRISRELLHEIKRVTGRDLTAIRAAHR